MNLEIHKPELVRRVNAHIQTGRFHDTDELLEKALDALEGHEPAPLDLEEFRRKSFVSLCEPVRGLAEDVDFSRNPSTARPLDL